MLAAIFLGTVSSAAYLIHVNFEIVSDIIICLEHFLLFARRIYALFIFLVVIIV